MQKNEYANLELDELIPMVYEIFAQIKVQTILNLFYETAFCAPCDERACMRALFVAQLAKWIAAPVANHFPFLEP